MATITKGYTFGATETVTNAKLHTLVDSATITGIVNADIDASANIAASKLNLVGAGYLTTGANFTITGTYTFSAAPTFSVAPTFNAVVTLPDSSQMATSAAPTSDADIANKKYVDDENLWEVDGTEHQLKTADEIDMQSKKIINVTDCTGDQDVATKKYVDDNAGLWETDGGDAELKTADDVDIQNMQLKGMCIENRTDDTGCTQTGRIWFRTDI